MTRKVATRRGILSLLRLRRHMCTHLRSCRVLPKRYLPQHPSRPNRRRRLPQVRRAKRRPNYLSMRNPPIRRPRTLPRAPGARLGGNPARAQPPPRPRGLLRGRHRECINRSRVMRKRARAEIINRDTKGIKVRLSPGRALIRAAVTVAAATRGADPRAAPIKVQAIRETHTRAGDIRGDQAREAATRVVTIRAAITRALATRGTTIGAATKEAITRADSRQATTGTRLPNPATEADPRPGRKVLPDIRDKGRIRAPSPAHIPVPVPPIPQARGILGGRGHRGREVPDIAPVILLRRVGRWEGPELREAADRADMGRAAQPEVLLPWKAARQPSESPRPKGKLLFRAATITLNSKKSSSSRRRPRPAQ